MFKAETLLLTACLFAAPLCAQEDTKATEATVVQLKEALQKAEAALKAGRDAEAKARAEAIRERDRAEAALEAAEKERDRAIQAEKEARQQQELAEQSQLEALRQAAQAKAAAEAEAIARKSAEAAEKGKASEPDARERKGKRGGKRKENIAALERQVEVLTRQMQDVQAELKALRDHITGEPGNKFPDKGESLPSRKSESFEAPLKTKSFKEAPTKEPKSPKEAGRVPGKASN